MGVVSNPNAQKQMTATCIQHTPYKLIHSPPSTMLTFSVTCTPLTSLYCLDLYSPNAKVKHPGVNQAWNVAL